MKKRLLAVILVAVAAATFGLGALSGSLLHAINLELTTRAYRERVNQDLMRDWPQAAAYFDGRAVGYETVATIDKSYPYTADFLRGVGETFLLSAELVQRAETTGSTDPVLAP